MTLRALENAKYMNANPLWEVCPKKKKIAQYYFTQLLRSFLCLCKAPLTKPVSVVLAIFHPAHPPAAGGSLEKEKTTVFPPAPHGAIKIVLYKQELVRLWRLR